MTAENKKSLIKLSLSVLVACVIIVVAYLIMRHYGITELSQEEIQKAVEDKGALAPLIFILISFAQVTLLPIPSTVTILAGNYLFGPVESFLYSYIGIIIGAMASFTLGKFLGRPFVNWIVGSKEKVDEWIYKLRGKEGVLLFFMFFFPFFPDDILCAIAGLLPFTWLGFLGMQLITRATSIFGTLFFMSGQIIPWRGWGLIVLALIAIVFIVAFIVCFKYAEEIDNFSSCLFRKVYYGEEYFLFNKQGDKACKRIPVLSKKFKTQNSAWRVAGVYYGEKGIVLDIYSLSNKKKKELPKVDFTSYIKRGENIIECEKQTVHLSYANPRKWARKQDKRVKKFAVHYKLENRSRVFVRCCYPLENITDKKQLENCMFVIKSYSENGSLLKETSFNLTTEKRRAFDIIKDLFSKKEPEKQAKK